MSPLSPRSFSFFALVGSLAFHSAVRAQTVAPDGQLMVETQIKPDREWKSYPTQTLQNLPGYAPVAAPVETDIYGGWPGVKAPATGFFYLTQINGRFWLIDPLGHGFINKAVVSVIPGGSANMKANLKTKYGTEQKWADTTTQMLHDHGFNGTGSWSDDALLRAAPQRLSYTPMWSFMGTYGRTRGATQGTGHLNYPKNAMPVFDPEFEKFCEEHAQKLVATKDDPYLLGHFSDNELPWPEKALSVYLSLPADDTSHVAALKWKNANVKGEITAADEDAFRAVVSDRYFSVVSKAIKKYDPNHLYLGARLHGQYLDAQAVVAPMGKYIDVMSANYYGRWTPDPARMDKWVKWTGKPFIITEWYTKGADSGMKNDSGAGWIVRTQDARGLFYQNFALGLLANPGCVGWQWFKYMDNDPEDLTTDPSNRNSNKGIVRIDYQPFEPLLAKMKELNENVYPLTQYFAVRK